MHFCKICQNMYYIRLSGENNNTLTYYCRKCGDEDDTLSATLDNICVSKTYIKKKGRWSSPFSKSIYKIGSYLTEGGQYTMPKFCM